ncbi:putative ribonuclease H-like domain-containing protein [Tanacetum coccineum]
MQVQNILLRGGFLKQEDEFLLKTPLYCQYGPFFLFNITLLKTDEKRDGPREEEQVFMDELERLQRQEKEANEEAEALRKKFEHLVIKEGAARTSSTNIFSTVSTPAKASSTNLVNTVSMPVSTASPHEGLSLSDPTNPEEEDDLEIPPLEDIYQNSTDGIFTTSSYDDEGAVADFTNLETVVNVSPIPTSRIHSTHPKALILGDPTSAVQTRSQVNTSSRAYAFVSNVQKQKRTNHKDFHHCLFTCFLSQHEPKKISEALEDESWVDVMQEELLQFEIQKVWVLVDLPYRKKAIGTKWVYRNKKDESGVVVRNKARLEAIRIFLAFASYMGFIVYQIDVKSAFLYGKIDEEVYVSQPPGFLDPKYPQKVYKVVKALYGLHQAPRAWYLKGKPKLGLWYPRVSSFDLESYSDSDYAGANLDRKSTTGEAEYVAAAKCCGQKSERNAEFHEILISLETVSIHQCSHWNEGDMTLQSVYDLCLSLCAQANEGTEEHKKYEEHKMKLRKSFKQLGSVERLARKIQEEWEADSLLAGEASRTERSTITIEERGKVLHDTIAAQRDSLYQRVRGHLGTDHNQNSTEISNDAT